MGDIMLHRCLSPRHRDDHRLYSALVALVPSRALRTRHRAKLYKKGMSRREPFLHSWTADRASAIPIWTSESVWRSTISRRIRTITLRRLALRVSSSNDSKMPSHGRRRFEMNIGIRWCSSSFSSASSCLEWNGNLWQSISWTRFSALIGRGPPPDCEPSIRVPIYDPRDHPVEA